MASLSPILDHVVIDVRERIDDAMQAFTGLGFRLTPRGHHTLGSANHLAMFATDYLELLGFGASGAARPELMPFPVGLNGLVFKTDDADGVFRHAEEAGLPVLPVQAFSRPVAIEGRMQDARFRTTRLDPAKVAMGRVYFCEHQTPELVWRPEWQAHPNGARAIARIVVATAEPRRTAALLHGLFGGSSVQSDNGRLALAAGTARVELMTPEAAMAEFGAAAADPAGRREYLAALEIKVRALDQAAKCLHGVTDVQAEPDRLVVPAAAAFNTAFVFSE
ncbi:MAG: VOC family protein [Stellaceae bacterium]